MTPNLHIHLGNSPELLAKVLAEALAQTKPADPMVPLRVGVGQRGMQRMVETAITHAHGVSANFETFFPTGLLSRAAYVLADDPSLSLQTQGNVTWTPDLLRWAVYAELEAADIAGALRGDVYDPLREWLHKARGPSTSPSRRVMIQLSAQLARVFDAYNLDRPEWHEAWVEEDTASQLHLFDGGGPTQLPEILAWQMPLWRGVYRRLAGRTPSPVTLLHRVLNATDDAKSRLQRAMPALHLFGMAHIHRLQRALIEALSGVIPVYLYTPSPTAAWWQDARIQTTDVQGISPLLVRFGEHTRFLHNNLVTMEENAPRGADLLTHYVIPASDHVLGHLQRAILTPNDDTLAAYTPAPNDASLSFHASHGPLRQVEVLHDVILSCLDRNPDIEPSDVVVLCPQLPLFAPLIEAVFRTTTPRLPYRIEDRSIARANPVAHTLRLLLEMADERPSAAAVMELLSQHVVRRRFGLRDDDIAEITKWLEDLDVRWGWNEQSRAEAGRPGHTTGTWQHALRRLALGVFTGPDIHGDAPDIAGQIAYMGRKTTHAIEVGAFIRCVREIFAVVASLSKTRTLREWCALFDGKNPRSDGTTQIETTQTETTRNDANNNSVAHNVDAHGAAPPPPLLQRVVRVQDGHSYELDQVLDTIEELRTNAETAQMADTPLDAAAFRTWLQEMLDSDTKLALTNYGAVSFARLTAARFASARVVLLLGMDDGAFPRPAQLPSWDLRQINPRPDDHSDRDEDLYAMLQALMMAREHFGILWASIDSNTGKGLPAALPVLELQRQIATHIVDGETFVQDHTIEHRLHPFSIDTFVSVNKPRFAAPFTYQHAWAQAALQGLRGDDTPRLPMVPADFQRDAEPFSGTVSAQRFAQALRSPQRAFLRDIEQIDVEPSTFGLQDDDPAAPNPLERIQLYRAGLALEARRKRDETQRAITESASDSRRRRLRVEAPLRPGRLGEATLEGLLATEAGRALEAYRTHVGEDDAPTRYSWTDNDVTVFFRNNRTWKAPDAPACGLDVIYEKLRYDSLLNPWTKLCVEAASTGTIAERVVIQLHDDARILRWRCTPAVATRWLHATIRLYRSLWQQPPAWTRAAARSLFKSNEKKPHNAVKTLRELQTGEEHKFYGKLNESWRATREHGGPTSWEHACLTPDRLWLPPNHDDADAIERRMPREFARVYAPLIATFAATDSNPDADPEDIDIDTLPGFETSDLRTSENAS